MNLPELKALLRKLIVDDIDLALQTAQKELPESSPKSRQVLLLVAQQADLKKSIQRAILSDENIELRKNQIRSSLIDLTEAFVEADFEPLAAGMLAPVTAASPKFLIVYANEDAELAKALNKSLAVLKITGRIKVYNVGDALGGEDPAVRAETELADTDYILVLITTNLFDSPWFALVYQALGDKRRVIPIRMEKADYDETGLEKLQPLPTRGRAVTDFARADEAYFDIVSEIKRLLPPK